jgi:hypothetical protein
MSDDPLLSRLQGGDPLLARLLAAVQDAQNPPDNRGAPAGVRAAVGAAQTPEDRLATLRRTYPDAQPYQSDNFAFTHPSTGRRTIYNPPGLDWGDAASIGPEIGEMAGGAVGGALAAPAAVAGAVPTGGLSLLAVPAGVGLGAAAGRQIVTGTAVASGQTVDTRGPGRQMLDAGTTALGNAAAVPAGNALAGLARGAMGPVSRAFGARTGQAALDDFANAGVTPSAGAVTGNRGVQMIEQGLEKTPGGVEPIRSLAERQASELGDAAERTARMYGQPGDPAAAGAGLRAGATAATERFAGRQEQLYDAAFNLIGRDTPTALPSVERLGQTIAANLAQAPESRRAVLQPVLQRIEALATDGQNGLPFEALRSVRTDLGRLINGPPNAATAPSSDTMVYLRQLYGALTEDMGAAARAAGPDAAQALNLADRYTRFGRNVSMPALERILDSGTDLQAYRLVFPASGKPDAQTLLRLRRNLQPEEWNTLAATVLDRMGTARPGVQGAEGDTFSVATFLTNWNKLRESGDAAAHVLFGGGPNAALRPELDRLARVAERLKDVQSMANPSGTARNLIAGAGMLAAGQDVVEGDWKGALGIGALGIVAPRYAANLITNPQFVRWLAGAAPQLQNPSLQRQALARLGAVAEANPELRDAIEAYRFTFSDGGSRNSPQPATAPR